MTEVAQIFRNGRVFDGTRLRDGLALRFAAGHLDAIGPDEDVTRDGEIIDLGGDIVSPGYVDLQVNGGDGVMFNDDPSVETLRRIASAHRKLGVRALLPTLITDTRDKTRAAIAAATEAIKADVPGIAGLHLEGPHLSVERKGAHDPALIRPMDRDDLDALLTAAEALPVLKVTIAPENVAEEQVRVLSDAGVLVSLGHTDAGYDRCRRYFAAGARCATHLFNAMSQLGNREPGLVGAVLADGHVSCGLIADAVHVHPETMRAAWAAKAGPGRIFLVSDAMAVAGTDCTQFELGGRRIRRSNGILTLSDGTLAGADLDLTTAVRIMVEKVGVPVETALQAATSVPAALVGLSLPSFESGRGMQSDMIRLSADLKTVSNLALSG
ncbi:N-acetylglucosamine-6-phosphate deacetylase [Primorskyibacter aestuariivivens]|uniref:N-acetylglucosamine-6-phosphate deacetylase n=1 Tax=Primorskyibacter aestuariivivens TaxID=1888912 RepID=UPI0023001A67|nr:N-acetylglucosamine-6-phosphate deacetylase [Primorskyibacter aestuariivivens]MDA7429717.1 N-acetylglucosamine-6-phosphate deacetylase [Primorskyibacter aestuariivivens]